MRKSIKLPEGTEEIWHRFRMMCLKKQTGGDGLANRQLVVLIKAWLAEQEEERGRNETVS